MVLNLQSSSTVAWQPTLHQTFISHSAGVIVSVLVIVWSAFFREMKMCEAVHHSHESSVDKLAHLTIVPDCQIRYKKTNGETVTLSTPA